MFPKFKLTDDAVRLGFSKQTSRSRALRKINDSFKRPFTVQEAVDCLRGVELGVDPAQSFIRWFIKNGLMVRVKGNFPNFPVAPSTD